MLYLLYKLYPIYNINCIIFKEEPVCYLLYIVIYSTHFMLPNGINIDILTLMGRYEDKLCIMEEDINRIQIDIKMKR